MPAAPTNVRSWGENGLNADMPPRPSLTLLGHRPRSRANSSHLDSERFQVCPKDRLTRARQAPDASNRLRPAVPSWYDRRRHPWEGPHVRHEAARVHHIARRCGCCVADCGTGAASGSRAAHRRVPRRLRRGRCGGAGAGRGVPTSDGAIGLDNRPQPANRLPLGHGRSRQHSKIRGGIVLPCAGRHSILRRRVIGIVAAGDAHGAHRVRECRRSGRRRLRQQPRRGQAATQPASCSSNTA